MLKTDAVNVEYLDLNSETINDEIYDLKGIEGFTNLKSLYAIGNKLSEIDLSENKLLDTLNLSGNNLNFIDLTHNPNLLMVDLKVNELTLIHGLSKATNLKWLNLSFNFFEEYIIVNPNLESFLMTNNELASFDADIAANLKTLYLLTNKLVHVDLSNNKYIEALNVSNNRLININLGQKDELNYFSCFSNRLSILDVSNINKLDFLIADRNPNLFCIKIDDGQAIPALTLSDYQQVNTNCD